ncbi:MAG: hypothetical protein ABUK01_05410 [Leptospirales bacterium]
MFTGSYRSADLSFLADVEQNKEGIVITFSGESKSRSAGEFLNPVFKDVLKHAQENNLKIILDFCNLQYMNSATVSPVIKYWSRIKDAGLTLIIVYDKKILWQHSSFSALAVFASDSSLFVLRPRSDSK